MTPVTIGTSKVPEVTVNDDVAPAGVEQLPLLPENVPTARVDENDVMSIVPLVRKQYWVGKPPAVGAPNPKEKSPQSMHELRRLDEPTVVRSAKRIA
jgi:hypothetical protein